MLPPELALWNGLSHIRKRGRNEWSASCPQCGEYGHVSASRADVPDRFRMWGGEGARGWCRKCGFFRFADRDAGLKIDPARILEIEEHKKRQEEAERKRVTALRRELQRKAYWRGYHDAMTGTHRRLWENEGITSDLQDWFNLGYIDEKPYYYNDELYRSPALTIPFFAKGEEVQTVQYKLIEPVEGAGKYRFTPEIPAPFYLTEPDKPLEGDTCLLVEGAKKAIVLYSWLGHKYDHIIGTPSKYMSEWMYAELSRFNAVFVVFDPDSWEDHKDPDQCTTMRAARNINNSRVVRLPVKPDDYLIEYHLPAKSLHRTIQTARRVA